MVDAKLGLRIGLFFLAMVKDAADLAVDSRPAFQACERFIVEARGQQRLAGEFVDDIGSQAEQVGPNDDDVKFIAPCRRASMSAAEWMLFSR